MEKIQNRDKFGRNSVIRHVVVAIVLFGILAWHEYFAIRTPFWIFLLSALSINLLIELVEIYSSRSQNKS